MKRSGLVQGAVVLFAVLLASSAFAGENSKKFELLGPAQVGGQKLAAGKYKLAWDGTGPEVKVQFMQGKKVLATAPARVTEVDSKVSQDSAVLSRDSRELLETRFAGRNYKLVFVRGDEAQQAKTGADGSTSN